MTLALDIVIIILVAVMIVYSVMLNIKLKAFRGSQNEMAGLIDRLNTAIITAQTSVETLKNTALSEEARLESLINKSRMLADELEIITESGSSLADRIERGLVPKQAAETEEDPAEEELPSEEDNEMLETLKKVR